MSDIQDMLGMGEIQEGIETNVDIVFVIDATASMGNMIETVKDTTLTFQEQLYAELKENKRIVNNLRVKVIWFRDFYCDGDFAYGESKFFELPEENTALHDFVGEIKAAGGGDDPESSLEALTLAMRSDFVSEGEKRRHIIVLFTDEEAHRFEDFDRLAAEAKEKYGCTPSLYPDNMPKDLAEFYNAWQGNEDNQAALAGEGSLTKLDLTGRRLVLCAPDAYPWSDMEVDLENILRVNLQKGGSGEDLDMSQVFPMIAMSMTAN